mgnify:FL=1
MEKLLQYLTNYENCGQESISIHTIREKIKDIENELLISQTTITRGKRSKSVHHVTEEEICSDKGDDGDTEDETVTSETIAENNTNEYITRMMGHLRQLEDVICLDEPDKLQSLMASIGRLFRVGSRLSLMVIFDAILFNYVSLHRRLFQNGDADGNKFLVEQIKINELRYRELEKLIVDTNTRINQRIDQDFEIKNLSDRLRIQEDMNRVLLTRNSSLKKELHEIQTDLKGT